MRMWIVAVVLVLAGRARADDTAGVTIDGFVVDGVIAEGVVVYAERVLPHAIVRVVGERVVVIARADAHGHVHVGGLPAGKYRLELEHGALADHSPAREPVSHRYVLDRDPYDRDGMRPICFLRYPRSPSAIGAPEPKPERRPFIDTSSTALVTVFDGH